MTTRKEFVTSLPEPSISKLLFSDTRLAGVWMLIRIYVGVEWLTAGWAKVNNPAWVGSKAGAALTGFIQAALEKTNGLHPDVQGWYADFLQNVVLTNVSFFSYLIAYGEVLVGIALIVGIFTGISAFFGAFMNMNFMLAGTVSINPILFICELVLILAWRVAGWFGVDRFLLPLLGAPWKPGKLFNKR